MPDPDFFVREAVKLIPPYNAGLTIEDVRTRYKVDRVAKLASNENPLGPSSRVRQALERALASIEQYPDPSGRALRTAIADRLKVSREQIVLGNGSEDLLSVICKAVLAPGHVVVTLYPSFPLHEDYVNLMGASIERVGLLEDLTIDVEALVEAVARGPRMVMFANPMNPVGSWLDPQQMQRVINALKPETLLVLDEAYLEYAQGEKFVDAATLLTGTDKTWIALRTFSKAWGLAALRIGYALVSSAELCTFLDRVRTPFNTNLVAQVAALAALDDIEHVDSVVAFAGQERDRVKASLEARGCRVAPSKGNFLFFDCRTNSVEFCEGLLHLGVIVKPWKQAGYDNFARVSLGTPEDNDYFLACHAEVSEPHRKRPD